MKQKPLNIGLFGFGCVGQGLYDVLAQTKGITANIKRICVKDRDKERRLGEEFFTYEKDELLNDPDIDVIVELIDDADAAFEIVTTAMKSGKGVVTANKKMVAEHFAELFQMQREYNVPFLYEASSCASIPVIRNLEEYYDNDLMNGVEGIFNGSSNYILSKIFEEGYTYDAALKEAQELGFAETDPTLDVGGFDAKYKLAIITAHAFGVFVKPEAIFNYGIQTLKEKDFQLAKEKGCKIKLVAKVKRVGDKLVPLVIPQFVKADHMLYGVNYEYNAAVVEGAFADRQFFVGKGAGSFPTGSAVLSDISALTYNYKYEYKKHFQPDRPQVAQDVSLEIYLRYAREEDVRDLQFESVEEDFRGKGFNYRIGRVKLSELVRSGVARHPHVFIAQTWNEELIVPEKVLEENSKELV